MTKKSSPAKTKLSNYFELAHQTKPLVQQSEVEELVYEIEKQSFRHKQSTFRFSSVGFRWLLLTTCSLLLLILYVWNEQIFNGIDRQAEEIGASKENILSIERESGYRIEAASYQRQQLLSELVENTNNPDASIQLIEKRNQQYITDNQQIPPLKVSQEILKKLGLEFKKHWIEYKISGFKLMIGSRYDGLGLNGDLYIRGMKRNQEGNMTLSTEPYIMVLDLDKNKKEKSNKSYYPLAITDVKGRQKTSLQMTKEDKDTWAQRSFSEVLDDLVPIAIPKIGKENEYAVVFWFRPTKEFFDILVENPVRATTGPNQEWINQPEPISLTIKQNPVLQDLQFKLKLQTTAMVNLDLISMDGNPVKKLLTGKLLESGTHEFNYDISSVPNGIYLLLVTTDKGRISKRIIKE